MGVGSDYLAVVDKADARVFFGVSTYAPWSTPHEVRFNISVDTDADQIADYNIFNSSQSALGDFPVRSDNFIAVVESLSSGTRVSGDRLDILDPKLVQTSIFNSDVMLLSVPASALGLTIQKPSFSFRVDTIPVFADAPTLGDSVDWMEYNMARPGLNLTSGQAGSPIFTDAPTTQLSAGFDMVAYGTSSAKGILLLHHHNPGEVSAESVDVIFQWPTQLFLPIGGR